MDHSLGVYYAVIVYIEGFNGVGTAQDPVYSFMEDIGGVVADSGLATRTDKRITAGKGPSRDELGLSWWTDGRLTPKCGTVLRLCKETMGILRSGTESQLTYGN